MTCLAPRLAVLALTLCAAAGCDPSFPHYGDGGEGQPNDEDSGTPPGDAWIAFGQGEEGWYPVENGDSLLMVLGGQGLLMFPMPLRGAGFTLPEDPTDWSDPDIPILDMYIDIDGYNIGFGDHFFRLANYPIPFEILPDGTYEFVYVTLFVPNELGDPCQIDGQPSQLHAELETADGYVLTWDRNVVIEVPEDLCGP